jgi:hypothetical protein
MTCKLVEKIPWKKLVSNEKSRTFATAKQKVL